MRGRGGGSGAAGRSCGETMRAAGLLPGLLLGLIAGLGQLRRGLGVKHAVYWNSSNPKFLREDFTLRVALNDYLDILCPHYDGGVPAERTESFVLYMVEGSGYRGCYDSPAAAKRWECNHPHAPFGPIRFLEKIQRFTPFSLGYEFQAGRDYYYFSIPDADSIGDCMKLRVSVCCRPTQQPVTEVPKSEPRGGSSGGGGRQPAQGDPQRQDRSSALQLRARLFLLATLCLLVCCF